MLVRLDRKAVRRRLLPLGRRLYRAVYLSPLRPLLTHPVIQRTRARLARPIAAADVLETVDVLARAGVPSWVAGGWGIDALEGTQTRPHKDLDLLIDTEHAGTAEAALAARGYRQVPEGLPDTSRSNPGSLMPHRLLVRDGEGRTIDLLPVRTAEWPGEPSVREPFATGTIDGREVACLSASAQAATHRDYEVPEELHADLALLARMLPATGDDEPA
jgi:lincosamide nucleotidyltransferase A/C/D/E